MAQFEGSKVIFMASVRDILKRAPVRKLLKFLDEQLPGVHPSRLPGYAKMKESLKRPYWDSLGWISNENLMKDFRLDPWFVEAAYLFFCIDGISCGVFERAKGDRGKFAFRYNDRVWTQTEVCRGDLVPEYQSDPDPDLANMGPFSFIVTSIEEV
ncbi:MAG: hypothetical protein V4719_04310, partial [Planctomycetota bacterium]